MRDARNTKKQRSFTRLVKAPFRFLIMARDAYVRSMTSFSAGLVHGGGGAGGFGLPPGGFQVSETPTALPRSFTLDSSAMTARHRGGDERYGEFLRAASARTRGGSTAVKMRRPSPFDLRRNCSSLLMGRIDEEKPCEFGEEGFKRCIFNKDKII